MPVLSRLRDFVLFCFVDDSGVKMSYRLKQFHPTSWVGLVEEFNSHHGIDMREEVPVLAGCLLFSLLTPQSTKRRQRYHLQSRMLFLSGKFSYTYPDMPRFT